MDTVYSTRDSIYRHVRVFILDNHYVLCHNTGMAKKQHTPEGNKQQLLIALYLKQGMVSEQVADDTGCSLSLVKKMQSALKHGWTPDLSNEAIESAPDSQGFNGGKKKSGSASVSGNSGNGTSTESPQKSKPAPAYVSFAAIQIKCQYTPIMYAARMCAEHKGWFPGEAPFEDFIDAVLTMFFKDRGITLQGYIEDDEVESGADGKIAKLQEEIEELKEILTKGGVLVG